MEMLWDFLIDNIVYIFASVGTILAIAFGKPKTAEQLEKLKNKKVQKLVKRGLILEVKLQKTSNKLAALTEKKQVELTEKKEGD